MFGLFSRSKSTPSHHIKCPECIVKLADELMRVSLISSLRCCWKHHTSVSVDVFVGGG